jgi:hypothetical protein
VARKRIESAADWQPSAEIDGFTYELGPDPADAAWASENLNGDDYHADDPTPDHVYDRQAEEAADLDRQELGIRF